MDEDSEFPLMNAILYKSYGPAEDPAQVLRLSSYQDVPEIEDSEILVEVFCFSVVPFDVKLLLEHPLGSGTPSVTTPMVPCIDGSGVVCEVGPDVTRFKEGDCVFFSIADPPGQAAAEWVRVPESMAALKPRVLAFKDAASLGSAACAAMEAIDWMGFTAGEDLQILILGGSTDVGSCAIRYCKYRKWTVHATAPGPEACEWCVRMGADRVINTDESDGRWVRLFEPHTVHGVFETRGAPHNFKDAEEVLVRHGGCFASIAPKEGHTVADAASFLPAYLWRKMVSPFSYYAFTEYDVATADRLDKAAKLAAHGVFVSVTYGTYTFDLKSVRKAFAQVMYDIAPGRPVVVIQDRAAHEKSMRAATAMQLEAPQNGLTGHARSVTAGASSKQSRELEARARAKASAEAAWGAFKRWCDRVNASIESLASPPVSIADLRERQGRLKAIKSDVQSSGKELFETLEQAVEHALRLGLKAGVSETVYKDNAAKVSENVRMADKAIAKMIAVMEKEEASNSQVREVEAAWLAFRKWCDRVTSTIDSLSSPPEGLADLQSRQAKIKEIKATQLPEGKGLYDRAESAITSAERAKVKLPGKVSLSALQEAASGVSASVQTADKAISKMIRKFQEKEKAAESQKMAQAQEQLQRFRAWCNDKKREVESLSAPPEGLDDLKRRMAKVDALKAEVSDKGKALYEDAAAVVAVVGSVSEVELQGEIQGVVSMIKKARKAIATLLSREEEHLSRQESGANEAKQALEKFRSWCMARLQDIEGLSAPPDGLADLRSRSEKIADLKADIKNTGKGLYEACLPLLEYCNVADVELQSEIQGVANRIKTADKAIKTLLKKEQEKLGEQERRLEEEAAKKKREELERQREEEERVAREAKEQLERERQAEEERHNAEKRAEQERVAAKDLDEFREWIEKKNAIVAAFGDAHDGTLDLQRRIDKAHSLKEEVTVIGKELYETCMRQVEFLPNVTDAQLKEELQDLAGRIKQAEKALTTLLKREQERLDLIETTKQREEREREEREQAELLEQARQEKLASEAAEKEAARAKSEETKAELLDWVDDQTDLLEGLLAKPPATMEDVEAQGKHTSAVKKGLEAKEKALPDAGLEKDAFEEVQGNYKDTMALLRKVEKARVRRGKEIQKESHNALQKAAVEAAEAAMRESHADFQEWAQAVIAKMEELSSGARDADDVRQRLDKVVACKAEVSEEGKKKFDRVLAAARDVPKASPMRVSKADLEKEIRAVAERVSKAQKTLIVALKKLEEARSNNKADEAVNSFKEWVATQKRTVEELVSPSLPADLKSLQEIEKKIDELRAAMRVEGRSQFNECCAMQPEVKEELKCVVGDCVSFMKKQAAVVEALVVEGLERQKNGEPEPEPEPEPKPEPKPDPEPEAKPEPEPAEEPIEPESAPEEASSAPEEAPAAAEPEKADETDEDEKEEEEEEATGGLSTTDKRKAMLEKLKQKKSEREGLSSGGGDGAGGPEDKKEAMARIRDKMNARKESSASTLQVEGAEGAGEGGEPLSPRDRKASLLARLQSRKKVGEGEEGVASIPETGDGESADAARDRKATLLAKIQSRKKMAEGDAEATNDEEEASKDNDGDEASPTEEEAVAEEEAKKENESTEAGNEETAEPSSSEVDAKAAADDPEEGKAAEGDGDGEAAATEEEDEPAAASAADRKAALMARLKEAKSKKDVAAEDGASESSGDLDSKKEALLKLKEKMAARKESKADVTDSAAEEGGEAKGGGMDRQALLAKLKSRKELKESEEGEGDGATDGDSRAAAMARLKQKRLQREESASENGATGDDVSAEDKRAALRAKIEARAASKKDLK